ncbi:hypothetical protein K431DRAFT_229432 [Polychaeton citri CBS 116435]|uniref:ATPase synthesis protein 25 n=1 Tax=Polychaeton citri CBS 116435 TaxID=1314669 RepID=A0A9P4UKH7_9PEZI|nr:hypothetical protein K431DRAFT_229432 [Polychaeton citri CBS 116435]
MSRTTGQAEQEATELPSAASSRLPWYLQPSLHPQAQTTARQQPLPALPINPPTILTPLMNHLSVDLGMDDMSLIDLRTLDPPPALGSNLIMLLSTARSEKHLHTSADRLCRHLRSVYHLSPFADGLLGRNELKLKLRRRAKRSRLLSAVGAKSTGEGEIDDGIRTGWVCVNVGRVEGGELPEEVRKVQRREGFVGFGGQGEEGCGIVVQMLTADKRGEMDLEKLWLGILKRAGEDSKTGDSSEQKSRDGAAELEQMAGNTT